LEKSELTTITTKTTELDPWSLYIYAMKSPMTRNRYQTRLAKFFDFIELTGSTLDDRARTFAKRSKYIYNIIMKIKSKKKKSLLCSNFLARNVKKLICFDVQILLMAQRMDS
jgi:hypothetical protein